MLKHECKAEKYNISLPEICLESENEKEKLKEYLKKIILPDLADIIFSYTNLLFHWTYDESHVSSKSFSCIANGIIDNKIVCLHTDKERMYQLCTGQKCFSSCPPKRVIFDNLCVYIVFEDSIRVTNIHELYFGEILTFPKLFNGYYLDKHQLLSSLRCIKDNILYINSSSHYSFTNTYIVNTMEPTKWYDIKNIRLFENKYTRQISADYEASYSNDYMEHNVLEIMVNRADDIIVSINKWNAICSGRRTIKNEDMTITCMPLIVGMLLYFSDSEIIYKLLGYLFRYNRITEQRCSYKHDLTDSDKIYMDDNFVCMCRNGRVDVYKS